MPVEDMISITNKTEVSLNAISYQNTHTLYIPYLFMAGSCGTSIMAKTGRIFSRPVSDKPQPIDTATEVSSPHSSSRIHPDQSGLPQEHFELNIVDILIDYFIIIIIIFD